MDDRGYLITHRDLTDPNSEGPPEEKHITHKEPLVANDILNHRGFVLKKVCSSFGDRTVQRYYQVLELHHIDIFSIVRFWIKKIFGYDLHIWIRLFLFQIDLI